MWYDTQWDQTLPQVAFQAFKKHVLRTANQDFIKTHLHILATGHP